MNFLIQKSPLALVASSLGLAAQDHNKKSCLSNCSLAHLGACFRRDFGTHVFRLG
jgi:hypothetical protein